MFRNTLAGGLVAAAIAAASVIPTASTASAGVGLQLFFGTPFHSHMMFGQPQPVLVCHTKFKWVWRHHKRHKIAVANECRWEFGGHHHHHHHGQPLMMSHMMPHSMY